MGKEFIVCRAIKVQRIVVIVIAIACIVVVITIAAIGIAKNEWIGCNRASLLIENDVGRGIVVVFLRFFKVLVGMVDGYMLCFVVWMS